MLSLCLASVVSRISPPLTVDQNSSEWYTDSPDDLHFAPSSIENFLLCVCTVHSISLKLVSTSWCALIGVTSLQVSFAPPIYLILLAGDIKLNPDPGLRHLCGHLVLFGPTKLSSVRPTTSGIMCQHEQR